MAHLGMHAPRPAPNLQRPGAFVEDPGESGGVWTVENGALPPLADLDSTESVFVAETADADAPDTRRHAGPPRTTSYPLAPFKS